MYTVIVCQRQHSLKVNVAAWIDLLSMTSHFYESSSPKTKALFNGMIRHELAHLEGHTSSADPSHLIVLGGLQ